MSTETSSATTNGKHSPKRSVRITWQQQQTRETRDWISDSSTNYEDDTSKTQGRGWIKNSNINDQVRTGNRYQHTIDYIRIEQSNIVNSVNVILSVTEEPSCPSLQVDSSALQSFKVVVY
jgi:hypothetical protein